MIASNVINLDNDESRCALIYGQMNEPLAARTRVYLTIAEYFSDEEVKDVPLFVDNIFRFT